MKCVFLEGCTLSSHVMSLQVKSNMATSQGATTPEMISVSVQIHIFYTIQMIEDSKSSIASMSMHIKLSVHSCEITT